MCWWLCWFLFRVFQAVRPVSRKWWAELGSVRSTRKMGLKRVFRGLNWLRGLDLNQRPSGYEPDELPGCSTPRSRERTTKCPKFAVTQVLCEQFFLRRIRAGSNETTAVKPETGRR